MSENMKPIQYQNDIPIKKKIKNFINKIVDQFEKLLTEFDSHICLFLIFHSQLITILFVMSSIAFLDEVYITNK